MALTVSFTAQSVAGEPSQILFTDTSTGSDGTITSRRIYLSDDNGDFLVEDGTTTEYEVWALPLATTITLDVLSKDYALKLVVQWLNGSNVVVYDYTIDAEGFTEYNEEADYGFTQLMAANPLLINDNNFWPNKNKLRTLIDSGNNAITRASDLYNAQRCYDAATDLVASSQYLFNGNA
jgi:hypothetical protein